MARELTVKIVGDTKDLERALNRTETRMQKFERGLGTAAKVSGLALGGLAIGMKKTTDAASALGESQNAVNVVFGEAAVKIHDFSKIAAQEAGLSMRELNELVTPIGAALQNAGFGADEAADASLNLAKRAADMASVFNVDVSEALGAIQAGLRGEIDPLERFGVGLSAAAVEAHALEMGMKLVDGELTQQQKTQARLSLLMEQTNKVAGDFKNTSDELANSTRINAAEAENASAKIGEGLLPVMEAFQRVISGVTALMGDNTTAVTVAATVAAGLAVAVLSVFGALKVYRAAVLAATAAQWLFNAAMLANPAVLVTVAIVALGAALVIAYKKSETFRQVVNASIDWVKRNWDILLAAIFPLAGLFVLLARRSETFRSAAVGAFNAVKGPVSTVAGHAKDVAHWFSRAVGWVKDMVSWIGKIKFPSLPDLNPFGDGVVGIAANPGGLSPNILDELGLAQAMGLTLTSGYRPGSVTSTGNPSLHGIGKAIDVAGPASLMAAYARAVAGRSGIRELIYTPVGAWYPGVGWTQPSGSVAADHYDHVHVGVFDKGGWLPPNSLTLAANKTSRWEPVGAGTHMAAPSSSRPDVLVLQVDGEALMRWVKRGDNRYSLRNG